MDVEVRGSKFFRFFEWVAGQNQINTLIEKERKKFLKGQQSNIKIPKSIEDNWLIWKVATSKELKDDYYTICNFWSLDEVTDAVDLINVYELEELKAHNKSNQKENDPQEGMKNINWGEVRYNPNKDL